MRAGISFVVLAAACGSGGGGNPDARRLADAPPTVDAEPADAASPDARIDARQVPDAEDIPDAAGTPDADTTPDATLAIDAATIPDAPVGDAVVTTCTAPATYGTPVLAGQTASHFAGDVFIAAGNPNADDSFQLQLYAGFGAFTGGTVVPGTYPLTGDEVNFATCGVCGLVLTDFNAAPYGLDDPDRIYFASSGTVTITSVTPQLTGTVDNLVLDHVTIDTFTDFSSTIVGDCQTTITSLAFDATVVESVIAGGPITLTLRPRKHH